ncbi:MAG: radical SAM protein [Planctomycetaceae bacterium]|nr:radical SAM protein [Planctomycetaceae bacterium]
MTRADNQVEANGFPETTPSYYTFYLTFRCHLKCPMCYQRELRTSRMDELSFPEIVETFDRIAHLSRVNLLGGEIFVRPDAMDVLEYFDQRGVTTTITTSAGLLTDQIVQRLSAMNHLLSINVSADGVGETYRRIRVGHSDSDCVFHWIRQLSEFVDVRVNSVLLSENLDEFEPLIEAVAASGAASLKVQLQIAHAPAVVDRSLADVRTWLGGEVKSLYPKEEKCWQVEDLKTALCRIRQYADRYRVRLELSPRELAGFLEDYASETLWQTHRLNCEGFTRVPRIKVFPNGDVVLCEELNVVFGNLRHQTPEDIWQSSRVRQFRSGLKEHGGLPICGRCCRVVVGEKRFVPLSLTPAIDPVVSLLANEGLA